MGSRITGTAHRTNGKVPERSVCQSNIYKSNHILKALREFTGQRNGTLLSFIKGRLLLSEIPPTSLFWGRAVCSFSSTMTRHLVVRTLGSPPACAASQDSFSDHQGGHNWALLAEASEQGRSSGRNAPPPPAGCSHLGEIGCQRSPCPSSHSPLICYAEKSRKISRKTFFFF